MGETGCMLDEEMEENDLLYLNANFLLTDKQELI